MRTLAHIAWLSTVGILISLALLAQPRGQSAGGVVFVTVDPSGSCSNPTAPMQYNMVTGNYWGCKANTWTQVSGGGGGGGVTSISTTAPIAGGPITTTGTITCNVASASQPGCLSSADWSTFNGKGAGTLTSITFNSPLTGGTITSSGSAGCQAASTSQAGCLSATDWNTFNGKGSGTVTTFSGSGPSWLTWTVSNQTTTPAASLAPTTGQTSHQVIGTCGAGTTFAPCSLVAGDLPALSTTVNSVTCTIGSTCTVQVPASTGITGLGTGVATALAANVSGSGAICLASGSACSGGGGGGVTLTAPISGDWTSFNTSGMQQAPTFASGQFTMASNAPGGSQNIQGIAHSLPSAPYIRYFRIWAFVGTHSYSSAGLGWADGSVGTPGKLVTFNFTAGSSLGSNAVTPSSIGAANFTNTTTFNSGVTTASWLNSAMTASPGHPVWVRLSDNSTNWLIDISYDYDGVNDSSGHWLNIVTETRNTFATATQLVVYVNGFNDKAGLVFDSYN